LLLDAIGMSDKSNKKNDKYLILVRMQIDEIKQDRQLLTIQKYN